MDNYIGELYIAQYLVTDAFIRSSFQVFHNNVLRLLLLYNFTKFIITDVTATADRLVILSELAIPLHHQHQHSIHQPQTYLLNCTRHMTLQSQ